MLLPFSLFASFVACMLKKDKKQEEQEAQEAEAAAAAATGADQQGYVGVAHTPAVAPGKVPAPPATAAQNQV